MEQLFELYESVYRESWKNVVDKMQKWFVTERTAESVVQWLPHCFLQKQCKSKLCVWFVKQLAFL